MSDSLALVRLLQLASPSLPVGAYSYSQGLESAIEAGDVRDVAGAGRWIADVLRLAVAGIEAPVLLRLIAAWMVSDRQAVIRWNDEFIASRETAELRAETLQMGYSLGALIVVIYAESASELDTIGEIAYPTAFAYAVAREDIDPRDALAAYLFTWIENQTLAAVKAIPLGQTEAQMLLRDLAAVIPGIVDRALAANDDALSNFAPGLAIASSRHETQYSRLFRS